ncbi:DUF2314 domain-containing protein [Luteimonas gilva]|uniref:DUF2314 domain-containing protein n=1 Tax=Luteimonas gilva TaxID=2572684 RepID=A0A4U5JMV7_9GAMM|nr:DUF2314 domain-containing protein [Luteimonas gilva]TKR30545.1 DUF2314 domain-containing protein [Luteimonas gilva]
MRRLFVLLLISLSFPAVAQQPQFSPNAPPDQPSQVAAEEMKKFEAAIAPYIAQAKRTYPAAKAKFTAGLPVGQSFFVTTRLYDSSGAFEQVFIAVRDIADGRVSGRIWNDIERVQGFRHGDDYAFPESDVMDWLITHADGSEEGNFVGKFLDTYAGGG